MVKQKKSSTVSAKQALDALLAVGYQTIAPDQNRVVRPTERAAVKANPDRMVSKSGKSIHLEFVGEDWVPGRESNLFVPAKGMLSHNEVAGLEARAKIKLLTHDH